MCNVWELQLGAYSFGSCDVFLAPCSVVDADREVGDRPADAMELLHVDLHELLFSTGDGQT